MTDTLNRLGSRLVVLRERAGLTQVELAVKAGVNPSTVSRIERGETSPARDTVQALARALGVKTSELEDECVETPVAREPAYPSLAEFLRVTPVTDDERRHLMSIAFAAGEAPDLKFWADALNNYRGMTERSRGIDLATPSKRVIRVKK